MFTSYLWDKFHYVNNPNLYMWIVRKKVPCAMTLEQFEKLLDNNYAQINGKQSEIISMEFLPMQNKAFLDFKQTIGNGELNKVPKTMQVQGISNDRGSNDEPLYNQNYAFSMWVYLNPQPPNNIGYASESEIFN